MFELEELKKLFSKGVESGIVVFDEQDKTGKVTDRLFSLVRGFAKNEGFELKTLYMHGEAKIDCCLSDINTVLLDNNLYYKLNTLRKKLPPGDKNVMLFVAERTEPYKTTKCWLASY